MFFKRLIPILVFLFLILFYFIAVHLFSVTCGQETVTVTSYYNPQDTPSVQLNEEAYFRVTPDEIIGKRVAYSEQRCRVTKYYVQSYALLDKDKLILKQVTKKNFFAFIDEFQANCDYCLQTAVQDKDN